MDITTNSSTPTSTSTSSSTQLNTYETLSYNDKINIIFDFNNLSNFTKSVLIKTYATLTINLFVASLGVCFSIFIYRPHYLIQTLLFIFAAMLLLKSCSIHEMNPNGSRLYRLSLLLLFAFLLGMTSGDMINFYIDINPSIVLSAFVLTCGIFITFTMFSLLSKDNRRIIYYGSFIFSLSGLHIFMYISKLFFNIEYTLYNSITSTIILIISVLFIMYDTQLIIYKIENNGDQDYITHSLLLLLDFVDLFKTLLSIFGKKESDRSSNKDKKK